MIWIEMSRDKEHGGGNWTFSKCIWAPTYKKTQHSERKQAWPFWENILRVQDGDVVIHLRGKGETAAFVGYSMVDGNGHKTFERPPLAGEWGYCESFYRAFLKDFFKFTTPINLSNFFSIHKNELQDYHNQITSKPKNIFFTIQSGRIQCLNGAYFTPVDQRLLKLLFSDEISSESLTLQSTVATSEVWRQVKQRLGQTQFSDSVKSNYSHKCCFPGCDIDDTAYLVASHIARWADNSSRRGDVDNGLCLCLMHDKAFESGYFSLDDNYSIVLSANSNIMLSSFFQMGIAPCSNMQIKLGTIKPSIEAIQEHRERCGI